MTEIEPTENSNTSSLRKKARLISIICLLGICLLFLLAMLSGPSPRTLNPTEKQLLGHWKHSGASPGVREEIEITPEKIHNPLIQRSYFWRADPSTLYFQEAGWFAKLKLAFGQRLPEAKWEINLLDKNHLEITYYPGPRGNVTRKFERVKP